MAHGCHPKCYHFSNMRGLEPKKLEISSDTLDKSFIIYHFSQEIAYAAP